MTATATADDKKSPDPTKDESYTEKVAIRRFVNGKLQNSPVEGVPAFRFETKDGALKFYTKAKPASTPTKGTEITDEKGKVFVVEKVVEGGGIGAHLSTVKPKP